MLLSSTAAGPCTTRMRCIIFVFRKPNNKTFKFCNKKVKTKKNIVMFKNFKKNYPSLYSVLEISAAVVVAYFVIQGISTYVAPTVTSLLKGSDEPTSA